MCACKKVFAFGETNAYVFVTNWSPSTEHSTQDVGLITFVPSEQIKVGLGEVRKVSVHCMVCVEGLGNRYVWGG